MKYKLFFLAALLGLSLACGGTGNNTADANSSKSNPGNQSQSLSTLCSNLHTVLPEDWEHTQSFSIDTDGDDVEECAVFYRFDIPAEEQSSLPSIGGVVYRPDDRRPPCIVPFHLYTCSRHYLCECKCKLNTQNVISEIPGDELVVEDHCGGEITAVSIFRWNPDLEPDGKYKPLGHFYGDRIKIAKDTVTLNRLLPGRAQFAMQGLYHPNGPEDSYYENVSDCYRVSAAKTRFIFYQGEPEEVTLSPYPEKVVLAFYNHYTNASEASKYLTEELWENTNKCAAGQCGCPQERTEIVSNDTSV